MGLFTVELEVGRETRAMIERVAAETRATAERVATTASIELELGPKAREAINKILRESSGDTSVREKIGGFLGEEAAKKP